jgi:hypothetical protein
VAPISQLLPASQTTQQQQNSSLPFTVLNKPKVTITTLKTSLNGTIAISNNKINLTNSSATNAIPSIATTFNQPKTTTTLKRPFVMFALFFLFGLNIFQFM